MAVALVALSICATGDGQLVANDYLPDLISEVDEARIGAEQHDQILAEFGGAYDDPKIAAYVDSIGQFLALTSERPNVKFTFTVLNSPIVNAFALPGGYIYVSRGLLTLAGDEAELAGVIAHEIGHVAARHGAQRMSSGIMARLGLGLLSILTDSPELAGIAQLGAMAAIQSYSRDQEFEADMLGVRYLGRAGFDTEAMASFLAKMRAHSEVEGRIAGHSGSGDQFDIFAFRIASISFAAAKRKQYPLNLSGFSFPFCENIRTSLVRASMLLKPSPLFPMPSPISLALIAKFLMASTSSFRNPLPPFAM